MNQAPSLPPPPPQPQSPELPPKSDSLQKQEERKPDMKALPPPPVASAAAPAAAPHPSNGGATDMFSERDKNRIAKELIKIMEKTKKFSKETKEDVQKRKLQAITGMIMGGKLNFEMKVDEKNSKLSLECTNASVETKVLVDALQAAKQLRGGKGRRGRKRAGARGAKRGGLDSGPALSVRKRGGRSRSRSRGMVRRSGARRGGRRGRGRRSRSRANKSKSPEA